MVDWSARLYGLFIATVVAIGIFGCHLEHRAPFRSVNPAISLTNASIPPPAFVDVSQSAGLRLQYTIPGKRPLNILQTIGEGCAFLDYNNDGNLDILLVGPKPALYRGDGHGRFTDVTHETGLDGLSGHFLGCAVGDYDNDGFDDIYLTAYRGGVLLHNERGRGFRDVTKASGLTAQPWATSAAFFDADGDGRLDLYVGDYVDFGPHTNPQLCNSQGLATGCGPTDYRALRGALFRNLGGGRFADVTTAWGLDKAQGRTLGVAAAPFGPDFRPTLAIANDETPGDLFVLQGARSRDIGMAAGMALSGSEKYGGMGIDWGDYDNDGRLDLVIATYQNQSKLVLRNVGDLFEMQETGRLGMFSSLQYVAFGVKWLDFDNDGWLDLMFANGHTLDNADQVMAFGVVMNPTYRQPIILYQNRGGKYFGDVSNRLAGGAERSIVGRGLAIGDFDNDGRIDALVVDAEGKPLLLHNVEPHAGHWLELKLRGTRSNRDGIGALVTVTASKQRLTRLCTTGGSYLSASDRRVHVGLGKATTATVSIRWPSGITRNYGRITADKIVSLQE